MSDQTNEKHGNSGPTRGDTQPGYIDTLQLGHPHSLYKLMWTAKQNSFKWQPDEPWCSSCCRRTPCLDGNVLDCVRRRGCLAAAWRRTTPHHRLCVDARFDYSDTLAMHLTVCQAAGQPAFSEGRPRSLTAPSVALPFSPESQGGGC